MTRFHHPCWAVLLWSFAASNAATNWKNWKDWTLHSLVGPGRCYRFGKFKWAILQEVSVDGGSFVWNIWVLFARPTSTKLAIYGKFNSSDSRHFKTKTWLYLVSFKTTMCHSKPSQILSVILTYFDYILHFAIAASVLGPNSAFQAVNFSQKRHMQSLLVEHQCQKG